MHGRRKSSDCQPVRFWPLPVVGLIISSAAGLNGTFFTLHIWAAAQENWFTADFIGQSFPTLLWQIPMRAEANRTRRSDYSTEKNITSELFKTFPSTAGPALMKRLQNPPSASQHQVWSAHAASKSTKRVQLEKPVRGLASLWFYLVMLRVI